MTLSISIAGIGSIDFNTTVEIGQFTSVEEVKNMISSASNMMISMFDITFQNEILKEENPICSYGLCSDSELSVVESEKSIYLSKIDDKSIEGFYSNVTDGNTKTVELYLKAGYDIEHKGYLGVSPLVASVCRGHYDVSHLLIKFGANLNSTGRNNNTSLHNLLYENDVVLASDLIESGADVNLQNGNGDTPLSLMVTVGNLSLVKILIENGANPNISNNRGSYPIHKLL